MNPQENFETQRSLNTAEAGIMAAGNSIEKINNSTEAVNLKDAVNGVWTAALEGALATTQEGRDFLSKKGAIKGAIADAIYNGPKAEA